METSTGLPRHGLRARFEGVVSRGTLRIGINTACIIKEVIARLKAMATRVAPRVIIITRPEIAEMQSRDFFLEETQNV